MKKRLVVFPSDINSIQAAPARFNSPFIAFISLQLIHFSHETCVAN
jgi:hypothetical protein